MSALAALSLCLVVAITDGDTLKARCGPPGAYEQATVRLSAIDAPERGQPYGNRAREALSALCFQTEAVITPRSRDRWGRAVADVQCRGQDAGEHLVRHGLAWVFDRYARGYESLYGVQDEARTARRGLWQASGTATPPVAPWDWRRTGSNTWSVQ